MTIRERLQLCRVCRQSSTMRKADIAETPPRGTRAGFETLGGLGNGPRVQRDVCEIGASNRAYRPFSTRPCGRIGASIAWWDSQISFSVTHGWSV